MIEVTNLTKRYGQFLAVDNVSFKTLPGEIVGLLGPNGAGKTTTMRMLTGFMPPTEGSATIAGHDIMSMEARRSVGYLPERVPVYPDMAVKDYIAFWARLRGLRKPDREVDAVLRRVHLVDRRNTLIRHLSKGMRQRLGLAQALVHNPPVVILDEPTIGIDPQQVIEVRESVRELGKNHTVLFSTHILSEAEQVCDRVLIINKGRIVAQGKPSELRRQLAGGTHLYIQIAGAVGEKAASLLQAIPGVTAVERASENGSDASFNVRVQEGTDIRAAVFERVSQAGFTLLELRPVATTLEDIFLDVVSKDQGKKGV